MVGNSAVFDRVAQANIDELGVVKQPNHQVLGSKLSRKPINLVIGDNNIYDIDRALVKCKLFAINIASSETVLN